MSVFRKIGVSISEVVRQVLLEAPDVGPCSLRIDGDRGYFVYTLNGRMACFDVPLGVLSTDLVVVRHIVAEVRRMNAPKPADGATA
jgi:hypothetical protein